MQSQQFHPDDVIGEEEARRRELLALARRPSYRKILNDLEGVGQRFQPKLEAAEEDVGLQPQACTSVLSHNSAGSHNGSASPCSSEQGSANFNDTGAITQNVSLRLENVANGNLRFTDFNPSMLLQYAQQHGHQSVGGNAATLLLPLNNSDLLAIKNASVGGGVGIVALNDDVITSSSAAAQQAPSAASLLAAAVLSAATGVNGGMAQSTLPLPSTPPMRVLGGNGGFGVDHDVGDDSTSSSTTPTAHPPQPRLLGRQGDDAQRKREVRLLKNREAAKECRRKKKEYIKCLENRVNTLEHQNTQLIEELKNLKALYCQKPD